MSSWSGCLRAIVAVGVPAVAFAGQKLIWPFIPPSPQLLFYPAVFLAARLAGARGGYVASVLSTVLMTYGFLLPEGFAIRDARDMLDLGIFLAVSVAMSHAVGQLAERAARDRAAKEAMAATWSMVAHDLRTPLSTIQMGSDLLAHPKGARSDAEVCRQAEIIERSSVRAASLVQDALDAIRLGDGTLAVTPAPCSLRELLARVADEAAGIAARSGIRLQTVVATTHATVLCDGARIAQVLANLLANAVRFTSRGGVIAVVAEDDGADVRITVRDTGQGIPKEDLGSVFKKHWTSGGGTGLGLWIARTIVEAHGRRLRVSSTEGAGTAFAFSLPAG
jgi:signal transduction histidine kinase